MSTENDKKVVDAVLKECGNLEKMLNDIFLPKFIEMHRANPKYNQLKLKQEVVASSSVFFTKKKYGLYIINKEGKTVSEYDVKGMIMRKSNFPTFSKEKVYTLLDMILKVETLDLQGIRKFIYETEQEMIELCKQGSKLIAGAVSFHKEEEEYKKIPYQINGMKLWNDLEYNYFIPGTKGYLFRIKGIDSFNAPSKITNNMNLIKAKNKHIVIPFEEEKLPEYYNLDLDAQLKFVWTDRVKEVIGVLSNTRKITIEDIFE